ncbi:ABC transporter permease [Candidatus Saccharibacteria bacterium]|nr:ABC transporter permease [Candidatus Saccharibacteria bacterium]
MALLFRTHYNLARESISKNRTRSFLTCLGIAIGVASIILILSLMGSIRNLVDGQVKAAGSDLIVVRPSSIKNTVESVVEQLTSSGQYRNSNLSLKDVSSIAALPEVAAAAPIVQINATLTANRVNDNGENYTSTVESAPVVATSADFAKVQNLVLSSGSFLEKHYNDNIAVVGRSLSLSLFGTTEPVAKTFSLFGEKFIVVGALPEADDPINFNNIDFDNSVFVNAEFLVKKGENIQVQQINVKAKNTDKMDELAGKIREEVIANKAGDTNFSVLYGDDISHPANGLFMIVSGMLTLVAGISLVVGGIGIMNIMLVSVAERTHEIGIRKSVGATSGNILLQFLFESFILSGLGGLFGLVLGYTLAFFISIVTPFAPYIDLSILGMTLATSFTIGLVFGIYPALKAAKKNPIESLRHSR